MKKSLISTPTAGFIKISLIAGLLAAFVIVGVVATIPAGATDVTPTLNTDNNPKCADFGLSNEIKFEGDDLKNGTIDDVTLSNYLNDKTFDWSALFDIDQVIVKGGNGAGGHYIYSYDPQATSDQGLTVPNNTQNSISHISFCYEEDQGGDDLKVTKTADTKFTRTWNWDIEKKADKDTVDIQDGNETVEYIVEVTNPSTVDSDWEVSGEITIENLTDEPVDIDSITDVFNDQPIDLTCDDEDAEDIEEIAAEDTITCTYSTTLPDGTEGDNEVTVVYGDDKLEETATAPVAFENPAESVNECVGVVDTEEGILYANLCADDEELVSDGKKVYEYEYTFGEDDARISRECGDDPFVNTARVITVISVVEDTIPTVSRLFNIPVVNAQPAPTTLASDAWTVEIADCSDSDPDPEVQGDNDPGDEQDCCPGPDPVQATPTPTVAGITAKATPTPAPQVAGATEEFVAPATGMSALPSMMLGLTSAIATAVYNRRKA